MRRGLIVIVVACAALAMPAAAQAQTRIVGGNATTIEEWPWQVAIADPPSTGGDGYDRQFCGGSLVAPTVVVTAAHCVSSASGQFQNPADFSVITGTTTLSSAAPPKEIGAVDLVYPIDGGGGNPVPESQLSPDQGPALYNPDTVQWDFALLELASAAPAPAEVIPLATAGDWTDGDPAWVTGWGGTLTSAGPYPDDLQEAEVDMVSDADCTTSYGSEFDPVTMVCAGIYPTGGTDTCAGDSGGPLVVDVGTDDWRLVGDTSWGNGCALPGFPGVYGRLAEDPMRSAVLAGITFAETNGGGGGGPSADTKAPETTIGKHPRKRTRKRLARFKFSADEPSSFECSLDGRTFKACESPLKRRVSRRRHTFAVRATDAAGNADQDPASFSWKVRKRRR